MENIAELDRCGKQTVTVLSLRMEEKPPDIKLPPNTKATYRPISPSRSIPPPSQEPPAPDNDLDLDKPLTGRGLLSIFGTRKDELKKEIIESITEHLNKETIPKMNKEINEVKLNIKEANERIENLETKKDLEPEIEAIDSKNKELELRVNKTDENKQVINRRFEDIENDVDSEKKQHEEEIKSIKNKIDLQARKHDKEIKEPRKLIRENQVNAVSFQSLEETGGQISEPRRPIINARREIVIASNKAGATRVVQDHTFAPPSAQSGHHLEAILQPPRPLNDAPDPEPPVIRTDKVIFNEAQEKIGLYPVTKEDIAFYASPHTRPDLDTEEKVYKHTEYEIPRQKTCQRFLTAKLMFGLNEIPIKGARMSTKIGSKIMYLKTTKEAVKKIYQYAALLQDIIISIKTYIPMEAFQRKVELDIILINYRNSGANIRT